MALTYPVDTTEPFEIQALSVIYEQYGIAVPDLDGMLRFLCWRFDPRSTEVRAAAGREAKIQMAERLSGWTRPLPDPIGEGEAGEPEMSDEWKRYAGVEASFLRLAWDIEWVYMQSVHEAIYNSMDVIRQPIPANIDPEVQGKMILNIQKAVASTKEAIDIYRSVMNQMADGDEAAMENIEASLRKQRTVRDVTGRVIQ